MVTPAAGQQAAYLCVDEFMHDAVGARALQSGLELGLIDQLLRSPLSDIQLIETKTGLVRRSSALLLEMLCANRVVEERQGLYALTAGFREALRYRDLLEAKLEFAALIAPDFLEMFSLLLTTPSHYFERARLFELFSYDRCFAFTPENLAHTRRWMRFTSALTKYESQVCLDHHDFSKSRRLLDVGGNSGEFALRICRAHPSLHSTVFDLPVVCDIGREHVGAEPEATRLEFIEAEESGFSLPSGFDMVCFKSMLHDWPDFEMQTFLENAFRALTPGGTLLIFERGKIQLGGQQLPYSLIPILLFFHSYRDPTVYERLLARIGFSQITVKHIQLETPFILISAVK